MGPLRFVHTHLIWCAHAHSGHELEQARDAPWRAAAPTHGAFSPQHMIRCCLLRVSGCTSRSLRTCTRTSTRCALASFRSSASLSCKARAGLLQGLLGLAKPLQQQQPPCLGRGTAYLAALPNSFCYRRKRGAAGVGVAAGSAGAAVLLLQDVAGSDPSAASGIADDVQHATAASAFLKL